MRLSSVFQKATNLVLHVGAVAAGGYLGAGAELACDIMIGTLDMGLGTYPGIALAYNVVALATMPVLGTKALNERNQYDVPYLNSGMAGMTAGFIAGGYMIGSFTPLSRLIF